MRRRRIEKGSGTFSATEKVPDPFLSVAIVFLLAVHAQAQEAKFVGVASCASTVCHGALIARDGISIPQNEYIVWSEEDEHARAYDVLLSSRSRAMADNLGIGDPQEAAMCLDCHATNADRDARTGKFQISDGVSCESCHGAASAWLGTHDDAGRTHAENVDAGMTDLADVGVRAQVCASCHVGDDQRFVSHRIMAAGHPRTSFELDTFTHLQPRHYRVDDDYRARKGEISGVQAWAVGQAAGVLDYFERLAGHADSAAVWPEFALFDCFSCHHDIGSRQAGGGGVRSTSSLGVPSVLRASATMYEIAADAAALPQAARIDSALRELETTLATRGGQAASTARSLRERAALGLRSLRQWEPRRQDVLRMLAKLSSEPMIERYRSYSDAEQATMAVQAVVATLEDPRAASGDTRLAAALDGLFRATASEASFRADAFAMAMKGVASAARSAR